MDYTKLISLLLLIPLTSSSWSSWSEWSECSHTCDAGLTSRTRNCTEGHSCEGKDVQHKLCNLQNCPAETADFREEQCSRYDNQPYSGEFLEWKPELDVNKPCALTCRAKPHGVTVTFASQVLDGTSCGQHSRSMCVNGVCKTIGCDGMLDSEEAFDRCGVCGGDSSSCTLTSADTTAISAEDSREVEITPLVEQVELRSIDDKTLKHFSQKLPNIIDEKLSMNGLASIPLRDRSKVTRGKKYNNLVIEVPFYKWEESAYSECSVTCGVGKQQTRVSCKNPKTGEAVIDRFCAQPKPPHHAKTCMRRSCNAKWVAGPWGSCSSSCGGGTSTRNVFCVRSGTSGNIEKVDDIQCLTARPPTKQKCNLTPCPEWQPGQWSKCSVSCGAGFQYRDVVCKRGSDAEICSQADKPVEKQRCHTGIICSGDQVIDHQQTGDRPFESLPDDNGITEDNRGGMDGEDYSQLAFERPPVYDAYWDKNDVNMGNGGVDESLDTDYYDRGGDGGFSWEEEYDNEIVENPRSEVDAGGSDVDYRGNEIMELEDIGSGDEDENPVITVNIPSFVKSAWGQCDVTCGHGQRHRAVDCKTLISYSNTVQVLPDYRCQGPKPATTERCIEVNCPIVDTVSRNSYAWQFSGYGPCTATCGGGFREPLFKCVRSDPRTIILVATELCARLHLQTVLKESCNEFPCPASLVRSEPRWQISPYGSCSHVCGGGIRRRQVRCVRDQGNGNQVTLPDQLCLEATPSRSQLCNQVKCPPQWSTGHFSQCSATCGNGMKTRNVTCTQIVHPNREQIQLADAYCPRGSRPDSLQPCQMESCVLLPKILSDKSYYVQLQQRKQLRFVAGGTIVIIPGTVLRIRCPVVNFDKADILWTKNGHSISRRGRTKRSRRGVLHIRGVKATDAGVYKCFAADVTSTTHVRIHSAEEALEKFRFREEVNARDPDFSDMFRHVIKQAGSNRKEEYTEPFLFKNFDNVYILPFQFITTKWGRCSKSCGGAGLQTRTITCEINMDQYYLVVSDDYCYNKGYDKPLTAQDCGYQICPEWETGEWGNRCTDEFCLDYERGARVRQLQCIDYNGMQLDQSMCDRRKRPRDKQSCLMETCVPKWTTTDWTMCSRTCGGEGIHTRSLQCVWEPNNLPATGMCENLAKPDIMKPCQTPACDESSCRDESNYCSLVQMLNLCRYAEYRTKCCASCTAIGRGPIRLHRYRFT